MTTSTATALSYYGAHGCALFPMRCGAKVPTGIVGSWKTDHSRDPAQWAAWSQSNPGCNFGLVASASRLIIVDVDVSEVGRETAWKLWTDWCAEHKVPVPAVSCQSARGGWHLYFRLPDGVDPETLTQRALIGPPAGFKKAVVDTRVEGFTVAAGSYYDGTARGEQSGHYVLMTDQPPPVAPDALIQHCIRTAAPLSTVAALGTRDAGDVAAMVRWMASKDCFADYESWLGAGMAIRTEFGDNPGLDLWRLTHDATVTADVEAAKWASFSTDANSRSVTLQSLMAKAHQAGWHGTIRKSTSAMFDGVAAIAAAAGASLSSGAMPMVAGQAVLCDQVLPLIEEFLSATSDAPSRPASADFPTIPDSVSGHGLFAPLQLAIGRIIAMAEQPKGWRAGRVTEVLAALSLVHKDTFDAVVRRVQTLGRSLPMTPIKLAASNLADNVEREFVDQGDWHRDAKGGIESDNSDNVAVFLGILGCSLRWNAWLERAEINGHEWSDWTPIDDTVVAVLRTRGNRTKTRFRPSKEFFWDSLLAIARGNTIDPATDALDALAAAWDGVPRLATWLSRACGTSCDIYHQSVSRNVIGGMVRRVREPGCKHDTMPIFYGYQGSGKSTMASLLAPGAGWFSDEVLLGDASKELVLSLAGKAVVEIGEMGMRNSANASHVKAMISRQVDRGRTAYARSVSERPRRNIFIGTTNDDEPLVDPTGNRRFLPVRVDREIDLTWLRQWVGQIIGEASALHARGDDFAIPRAVWGVAAAHQESARSASDLEIQFQDWFGATAFTANAYVSAADLSKACKRAGLTGSRSTVMRHLGFVQGWRTVSGKKARVWIRGEDSKEAVRYGYGVTDGDVRFGIGREP